ncbi:MAG: hypothetical protein KBT20_02265 [Bacteroidales bacterium]|nr:hypothetical protein [Candidatus Liminaster caballi]
MKKCLCVAALSAMFMISAMPVMAEGEEESVSFEVGADVVSAYIWRGQDFKGFSVQPSATVTFNKPGISFGVWGSAELFQMSQFANMSEFDLLLSWSPVDALSIGVTDYHFCVGSYIRDWDFSATSVHNLEANLSYDFGPLAIAWNTVLTGFDYNAKGKRAYSTYVEVTAPFTLGDVECTGIVGLLPWEDCFTTAGYNTGFNVCNLSLKAEKKVKDIPLFGQIIYNPQSEGTYFVFGVSF